MLPIDPHVYPRKWDALFTLEDPYSPWSSHVRFAANEFKLDPRAIPLHFLSPRNWFVSRRGWFCLQRSREAKVDYRIYGQRGWKKSGPFDAKWILEEASGKRAPLPFFQLLSLAPSATSSHTPSLPFDFDAFPLCYRLSLCACRPWRGKRLHPLPPSLSNSSRSTITTTTTIRDVTKVKGSEISRNLCVRVTRFRAETFLPRSLTLSPFLFLPSWKRDPRI